MVLCRRGFYRSGEFKFFIVDAIRHLIDFSMIKEVREINSICLR